MTMKYILGMITALMFSTLLHASVNVVAGIFDNERNGRPLYSMTPAIVKVQWLSQELKACKRETNVLFAFRDELAATLGGKYGISDQEATPKERALMLNSVVLARALHPEDNTLPYIYAMTGVNLNNQSVKSHVMTLMVMDATAKEHFYRLTDRLVLNPNTRMLFDSKEIFENFYEKQVHSRVNLHTDCGGIDRREEGERFWALYIKEAKDLSGDEGNKAKIVYNWTWHWEDFKGTYESEFESQLKSVDNLFASFYTPGPGVGEGFRFFSPINDTEVTYNFDNLVVTHESSSFNFSISLKQELTQKAKVFVALFSMFNPKVNVNVISKGETKIFKTNKQEAKRRKIINFLRFVIDTRSYVLPTVQEWFSLFEEKTHRKISAKNKKTLTSLISIMK